MASLLYRALLALLPRRYTPRDRLEMREAHVARLDHAAPRGRTAAWRVGAAEVVDLAGAVVREHLGGLTDTVAQDVRMGMRSLTRAPLVSALAVVSLALGIGATSALFSAVDVWLWRPLPVPNQDRLVRVFLANRDKGWSGNAMTLRDFVELREGVRTVDLATYRNAGVNLATDGRVERISALQGSANLLPVLGVEPALGRAFRPEEERAGTPRAALLADAFWRAAWGADPTVLGRTLLLDGERYSVVGVLPPRSALPDMGADVWIPLRLAGDEPRTNHMWFGVGLPRARTELGEVARDLDAVASAIAARDPGTLFPNAAMQPIRDYYYSGPFRQGSYVLLSSVLFVLLIACANIANLLLARGVGRTHEMAVRGALGAGRTRVVRQLLTENGILALLGGLAGVGVAHLGIRFLVGVVFPPDEVPGLEQMALDGRVLTAIVMLTVLSALLFGLVPSLHTSRVDLRARLGEGGRGTTGGGRDRLGKALVVAEITLALALLATTGLVVRSLVDLNRVEMGFRTDDALSFAVSVPATYLDDDAVRTFHAELTRRIAALPGVVGAAASTTPPVGGYSSVLYSVGSEASGDGRQRSAWYRRATADYARVMGMPMAAGRWFDDGVDVPGGAPVAVVSRALARRDWGGEADALGRTMALADVTYEIVGVADAGRLRGPQMPPPAAVFLSATQVPSRTLYYVVDAAADRSAVVDAIRAEVRGLDPLLAVFAVSTLEQELRESLEPEVVVIEILGTLAILALALTLVGVYGVMAHSVGRRARELGLRTALGADPGSLLRLVLAQSGRLAALGIVLGLAIAVALGKLLAAVLVGLRAFDAAALGGSAAFMVAAAVVASWLPARRAARVDPVRALQDG